MPATNIQLVGLDFDTIKQNLITFLQNQSIFSDYNFTGSGLNVLLDVLAYNTGYLGYYLNMVANESFLDSAKLRESVVSIAKQLGYLPQSRHAAEAIINLIISPPNNSNPPATLVIPQNTQFITSVNNVNYTFGTTVDYTVALNTNNNTYALNNVTIVEGLPFTFTFTVDTTIPNQAFVIPNSNVDISTISVRVQNSITDTTITVFNQANDINTIDGTTAVYFLQEVNDEQYQIYFGDGILGQALVNGNLIIVQYTACNADAPNLASTFVAAQPIGGYGNIAITTTQAAFGGAERETIESVRFNAPKSYQVQGRAVTVNDYTQILTTQYPNINSLSIWGGEDNVPPVYGSVFISLQPKVGFTITETIKQFIINTILGPVNVLTVTPVIIDPNYIFLNISSTIKFNPSLTTLSPNAVQAEIIDTINNFSNNEVSKFNTSFYYSSLVSQIDQTDPSIVSNVTSIIMQQRIVPILNQTQAATVNFTTNNSIVPGSIISSNFVSNALGFSVLPGDVHGLNDDGNGNIQIFKKSGSNIVVVKANAGTVNYSTGLINITALNPASIVNNVNYIQIFAKPVSPDVLPLGNNIITIDPNAITVNMVTVSS